MSGARSASACLPRMCSVGVSASAVSVAIVVVLLSLQPLAASAASGTALLNTAVRAAAASAAAVAGTDAAAAGRPPVLVTMDSPCLAVSVDEDGEDVRWLSVFVTVKNQSDRAMRIRPADWQLRDAKGTHAPAPVTDTFDWLDVVDGDGMTSLENLRPQVLTLAPAQQARIGLFFQPLAIDVRQPDLTLTLNANNRPQMELDLDQLAADRLQITAQRIGPAGAVGLLRIGGELNSLSASRLVQQFDQLADQERVLRFVIALAPDVRIPDPEVMAWLRQLAGQTGLGELYNDRFAALTEGILAVHLTSSDRPTEPDGSAQSSGTGTQTSGAEPELSDAQAQWDRLQAQSYEHVHEHLAEAVEAAVSPLCERLPRSVLLRELRTGEVVSQQAVLRHCGERLIDADLPLILSFLDSRHRMLQLAAFETLRHFENAPAIEALLTGARSADESTADAALTAMATSRYGAVRDQLLALLESSRGSVRQRVARALARHPQPDWAPRLLQLAADTDPEIRRSALTGLFVLGHPRIRELLRAGLAAEDASVRNLALRYLMSRSDPESEQLAMAAVLTELKTAPPSERTARFLQRVRDRRVIPQLRRWLDSDSPQVRRRTVQIMLATGDQAALDELASRFDALGPTAQADVLVELFETRSPRFWKRVSATLPSGHGRLQEVSLELLRRDGTARAVTLLARVLHESEPASSALALSVAQTLAAIGTPAARDVLIRETTSEQKIRRSASSAALQQLYARSPAMPFMMRGAALMQNTGNATLALLHFNLAIQADAEHPPSRMGRADIVFRDETSSRKAFEAARDDLRIAARFDPSSAYAVTGLALAEVRLGNTDAGIRLVENARSRFSADALYYYNTACVYGRAIEVLEAQLASSPSRAEAIRSAIGKYRRQAIADLRKSIDNGLDERNREWMQSDPDLNTVRTSPAFDALFHGDGDRNDGDGDDSDRNGGNGNGSEPPGPDGIP